jgi:hypothetical protein
MMIFAGPSPSASPRAEMDVPKWSPAARPFRIVGGDWAIATTPAPRTRPAMNTGDFIA